MGRRTPRSTKWRTYEEVAAYLIGQFREHFGLERVEGKQKVRGNLTGTYPEIDAKGIVAGREGLRSHRVPPVGV